METLPYVFLAVGVSFLAIVAAIRFTLLHHETRNKIAFLLVLGSVIWLLMSALEVVSDSLPTKLVIYKVYFVGVLIVPTTWLILTIQLSGYGRWIKRSNLVVLGALPVISLLLVFTNESHGLMWSNITLNSVDPFLPLNADRGLGYWLLIVGYSYVALMFAVVIFGRRVVASRSLYRRQPILLIFIACVPWALNAVWFVNPSRFMYINPAPLGLTVATSITLWRMAYLPGADIIPVAHEMIVDSMNEAVIILNAQTRIVELNPRAQQLVGHNLSDALGKPVERIWAEWAGVKKELDSGTERVREVSFGVGEEKKVYEMQRAYLSGITSERPNLLIILRDITERKILDEKLRLYSKQLKEHSERLEELVEGRTHELKKSEEKYRLLVDNMAAVVFTIDTQGNFTFVNRVSEELTGYSAPRLLSMNMKELIAPEFFSQIQERLQKRIKGERELPPVEFEITKADGKRLPVEMMTTPILNEENALIGVLGVVRDITERKRMEEVKNHLMSAVTHELRTPLTSLNGYLELVMKESRPPPSQLQSDLEVMKRNTDRLLNLTNDLLDIQRMKSGKLQLNMEELDLRKVVDEVVDEITPLVQAKKQSLIVEHLQQMLPIRGDQMRLNQVLINLLSNAIKFTNERCNIIISTRADDDLITVAVSDTGIGIKKEDLNSVFDPFAVIQKPSYIKGTGLGLSVSKGLIEAHGGKIWAESAGEGKGATFTFTLPKREV